MSCKMHLKIPSATLIWQVFLILKFFIIFFQAVLFYSSSWPWTWDHLVSAPGYKIMVVHHHVWLHLFNSKTQQWRISIFLFEAFSSLKACVTHFTGLYPRVYVCLWMLSNTGGRSTEITLMGNRGWGVPGLTPAEVLHHMALSQGEWGSFRQ